MNKFSKLKINKVKLALLILMLFGSHYLEAHERRAQFNVDVAIRSADMIFLGTVKNVAYASSTGRGAEAEILPHTFVTYQIMRLIKGNPQQAQDQLTLRFLGGRGKEAQFLYPANYPLFDLGDMDVIFVKGNTVSSCPLVECANSRMRSLQEMIFNDRGQQVVMTRKQQLAFGKFEQKQEILTHQISQTTIHAVLSKEESEGGPDVELPIGQQINTQTLVAFLEAKVKKMYPPDQMAKWPIVPSANIQMPFTIKPLRTLVPKALRPVPPKPIIKPSPADQLEEQEFNKNEQNPVIKQ